MHDNEASHIMFIKLLFGQEFKKPLRHDILSQVHFIRASVDALCRDGTSEISRDPRTKRLQTRRESIARPSEHTNNNF